MKKDDISLENLVVERAMNHEDAIKLAREQMESGQYQESDHPYATMSTEDMIRDMIKNHIHPTGSPEFRKKYHSIMQEMIKNGEITL